MNNIPKERNPASLEITRATEKEVEVKQADSSAAQKEAELIAARNGWLARFVPQTEESVAVSKVTGQAVKVVKTSEVNEVTREPRGGVSGTPSE